MNNIKSNYQTLREEWKSLCIVEITALGRLADPHSNRAFQIAVTDLGQFTLNVILKTDGR